MRRSRFSFAAAAFAASLAATLGASHALHGQDRAADGALFLLLPVGARAVGMGQAMAAERAGSEAVWWNPAGIAGQDSREAAIHHSQTITATGDALTVLFPQFRIGSFAISANVLNFGDQQITDAGGDPIGLVLPRNLLLAGTYGGRIGARVNAGITYKLLQYRVDCSGQCANVSTFTSSSSAVDAGAQYTPHDDGRLTIGAAVRNVGTGLRISSGDEADDLPARIQLGAGYRVPLVERYLPEADLRIAADVLTDRSADEFAGRLGADLAWQKRVHLRAGYAANDLDGSTAAVGFGLTAGRLVFDIARTLGGLSADAGQTPTYFSLRYLF